MKKLMFSKSIYILTSCGLDEDLRNEDFDCVSSWRLAGRRRWPSRRSFCSANRVRSSSCRSNAIEPWSFSGYFLFDHSFCTLFECVCVCVCFNGIVIMLMLSDQLWCYQKKTQGAIKRNIFNTVVSRNLCVFFFLFFLFSRFECIANRLMLMLSDNLTSHTHNYHGNGIRGGRVFLLLRKSDVEANN